MRDLFDHVRLAPVGRNGRKRTRTPSTQTAFSSPRALIPGDRGDWKIVNGVALRLLADAETTGVHPGDVQARVLAAAKRERLDDWTFQALRNLFLPPIALAHGDDGSVSFSNEIHRTQAMRDAKTHTTIVAEHELVGAAGI
ncbi:hypothetical protein ACFWIW_28210 [Amycolatopsis sp. NPDC058340]|uniref:hypothetical protein n=1 Tax=Amycolatopsis sp. NPDC058340 TaxID=3346453 RepID=UPI003667C58E